jgi:hypothetical protein
MLFVKRAWLIQGGILGSAGFDSAWFGRPASLGIDDQRGARDSVGGVAQVAQGVDEADALHGHTGLLRGLKHDPADQIV